MPEAMLGGRVVKEVLFEMCGFHEIFWILNWQGAVTTMFGICVHTVLAFKKNPILFPMTVVNIFFALSEYCLSGASKNIIIS
jgi:hypothetical protein